MSNEIAAVRARIAEREAKLSADYDELQRLQAENAGISVGEIVVDGTGIVWKVSKFSFIDDSCSIYGKKQLKNGQFSGMSHYVGILGYNVKKQAA